MAVDVAYDGETGHEKSTITRYDVVVLDRDLPGMSGDRLCAEIVRSGSTTRVLMLTASGTLADKVDGLSRGADDYLAKPFDFPELVFVTRHGCEPWADLIVKLMLKWPNLYYSTSAFAPKYYPKAIIDYANTRGADKVIYAGYHPMGISIERIMTEMQTVPFRDHVWPKFLCENAKRVLKLDL